MAKSYIHEIPEGYEARIEGDKVIIELAESEGERIRKGLVNFLQSPFIKENLTDEKVAPWIAYLEKQKEPHYTKRNALFDKCVAECDPEIMQRVSDEIDEMLEKEQKPIYLEGYGDTVDVYSDGSISCKQKQKPASTEDMPYITDEHFYEREPVDSFKYKLAEYMTRCCTKKEGPYGYEYGISAETILKMAEEELLKRGVVQKPAEWSEEDEKMLKHIIDDLREFRDCETDKELVSDYEDEIVWLKNRLKSLHPQPQLEWSEEDEKMRVNILNALTPQLVYSVGKGTYTGTSTYKYDDEIKWLKSLRPSWKPSEVCYGGV